MKTLRIKGAILLGVLNFTAFGQQLPTLSSFTVNNYLINPANAGVKGNNAYLINRNQYHQNKNASETFMASVDGNFKNPKFGYGVVVYNDVLNAMGRSGAYGTYTYRLTLPQNHLLTFGLSFGAEQKRIQTNRLNSDMPAELTLTDQKTKEITMNGNFGIGYQFKNFQFGFAGYRLFDNSNVNIDKGSTTNYDYIFKKHFTTSLSYKLSVLPRVLFIEPIMQIRMAKSMEPQAVLSLLTHYKEKFWVGASYRQAYGTDIMAGVNLAKQFKFSYTFAIANTSVHGLSRYTNELMLGYQFGKRNASYDKDKDGVPDYLDKEPETSTGCAVDKLGVALDSDRDNVPDCKDKQVDTPFGAPVDAMGIALDSDHDSVIDLLDQETDTPEGNLVDANGITLKEGVKVKEDHGVIISEPSPVSSPTIEKVEVETDSDKDNVPDILDKEIETPHWKHVGGSKEVDAANCIVDVNGVATDSDNDGVMDCVDEEIFTPKGSKVDANGISVGKPNEILSERSEDSDGDGISDELDLEPDSPKGVAVDQWGRSPLKSSDPSTVHRINLDDVVDNSPDYNYYVIIGVFRYYNNLKNYQKYLLKNYNESTQVLTTSQSYYFVWTKQVSTQAEALKEFERIKTKKLKDYIVGNPWLWQEEKRK
jgi:type IX secretion system PorP/SprF family membrane protein